jgi:hypothetical protein
MMKQFNKKQNKRFDIKYPFAPSLVQIMNVKVFRLGNNTREKTSNCVQKSNFNVIKSNIISARLVNH